MPDSWWARRSFIVLGSTLGWDLILQFRQHVLTANLVSTLFIMGFVALLPAGSRTPEVASFFVFADPAMIGLSIVGAVVLMERAARVDLALGVTPIRPATYLAAKTLSLSLSGTLSGLGVSAALALGGVDMSWPMVLGSLIFCNVIAVLLGFILVASARSMPHLMVRLIIASLILYLPLLAHFGVVQGPFSGIFLLSPATPMLWLMYESFSPTPRLPIILVSILLLCGWLSVLGFRALRSAELEVLSHGPR